jgi:hypothetical protein
MGKKGKSKIFDYESMYSELNNSGLIFDIEETSEEILFKFKTKDFEKLEKFIAPKPVKLNKKGKGKSCFSVKKLRKQLGIKASKKHDIPIEKLDKYKQITSVIDKGNISVYNKINDGFLTDLSIKNNSSLDALKEKIKDEKYSTRGYLYSLGEETWNKYLDYIKNYIEENL